MNRLDEIIEKYFAGNSSLEEELELKNYFSSTNIETQHKKYIPLFRAFEKEQNISYTQNKTYEIKKHPLWIRSIYILSGVAAACLLLVTLVRFQLNTEDYMVVNGKRINDSKMARDFANAKLEKSLNVVYRNLDAYKNNKIVADRLKEIEIQLK